MYRVTVYEWGSNECAFAIEHGDFTNNTGDVNDLGDQKLAHKARGILSGKHFGVKRFQDSGLQNRYPSVIKQFAIENGH